MKEFFNRFPLRFVLGENIVLTEAMTTEHPKGVAGIFAVYARPDAFKDSEDIDGAIAENLSNDTAPRVLFLFSKASAAREMAASMIQIS